MKKILLSILTTFLFTLTAIAADITFEWDANTEEDLAGYKINWGFKSRITNDPTRIDSWCAENWPDTIDTCKNKWLGICEADDRQCDYRFFSYDNVIDVENVTEFTVSNLPNGELFFAATAYDNDGNESIYSNEISLRLDTVPPGRPLNFKVTVTEAKSVIIKVE